MKYLVAAFLFLSSLLALAQSQTSSSQPPTMNAKSVERFANLALACVHKEYPNHVSHTMNGDADVQPPRKLTPAFYGCYDWHSSVHGHWLLARIARTYPDAAFAKPAREALAQSLTAENIRAEAAYIAGAGRASFERPYGLAWLLQLSQELREWGENDEFARGLSENLKPLEDAVVKRVSAWLPNLQTPIRFGEHDQTAFAMGLMLDYARPAGNKEFESLLKSRARVYYEKDAQCPMAYEPSGEDFLSPCLAEADVMRRVMAKDEYRKWLAKFLPQPLASRPPKSKVRPWLSPVISADRSDPKLAHLDGLNLSRAWMLEGIVSGLAKDDPLRAVLEKTAAAHREAGLAAVTGEHYEGGHWLGSFAVYLVTKRGTER